MPGSFATSRAAGPPPRTPWRVTLAEARAQASINLSLSASKSSVALRHYQKASWVIDPTSHIRRWATSFGSRRLVANAACSQSPKPEHRGSNVECGASKRDVPADAL